MKTTKLLISTAFNVLKVDNEISAVHASTKTNL